MQAPHDPAALHTQKKELQQQFVVETRALYVLTQLSAQVVALGNEGRAPAWRERLITTLQERMTETEAEILETRAALAQLAACKGQLLQVI